MYFINCEALWSVEILSSIDPDPDSSADKESACNATDPVQFLDWENPLEKG